jgi:glycosyltransferase involved in cell wall biosynthesis
MQETFQITEINQPLLTIAIPTYNRARHLELCLMRIHEELVSLPLNMLNLVKVYVSNNASTDDTNVVISNFQLKKVNSVELVHNQENIGAERNVVQCYESSTTPYVWILGDDDVILPGALKKILDVLLHQDVDILYLNHYWFKDEYLSRAALPKNTKVSIYTKSLDFARRTNVMLTFISGQIVRTGINFEQSSVFVRGSNLPQFGWILPLLRDGNCFVVVDDECVAAKGGNSGGYGLVKVFGESLKIITDNILKDKPEVARAIQNGTIIVFFPGFINAFRKGCSDFTDKEMAVGLKQAFGDNWRYYLFLAPLLNMPLYFSRCYYYLVRLCSRLFGSYLI